MKNYHKILYRIIFTALFAALIFVGTFLFKISTGLGYIHLGDGFIFIAAVILPTPYAAAAAAIGGGLSDLIGYPLWIPGTVIIKAASVLLFTSKNKKLLCARNYLALAVAALINIGGYYIYGSIVQANFVACLYEMPLNLLQEVAGAVVFCSVAFAFDINPRMKNFISNQVNGR